MPRPAAATRIAKPDITPFPPPHRSLRQPGFAETLSGFPGKGQSFTVIDALVSNLAIAALHKMIII
jgi:hypothetical protein